MTQLREQFFAQVSKVDDPEKRGRIMVTCAAITGDADVELPMWIEPALDWGLFVIPEIGETVEIDTTALSEHDESFGQASIEALDPHWRGTRFYDTAADAPVAVPHPDFTEENYGKRRGFHSKRHTLVFDDTEGDESITISWRDKNGRVNQVFITDTNFAINLGGGATTFNLAGGGTQTQMLVGSAAVSPAISEYLALLWASLVTQQSAFNALAKAAVAAVGAVAPLGPTAPAPLIATMTAALTALAAANPSVPVYTDSTITSDQVKIPDNL